MPCFELHRPLGVFGAITVAAALSGPAGAETSAEFAYSARPALQAPNAPDHSQTANVVSGNDPLSVFTPGRDPINHTIDYSIWDYALENLVVSMGPSNRKTAGSPEPSFLTRRQYGHRSRYRLEGAMVTFSFFDRKVRASFTEYREDLQRTAELIDIESLPRNEQLAYWFNLHNVALIEQIAYEWPVREPRKIEIDGVLLDDARFITVEGVALSLRDIREKIVFRHWRDPRVIYGFWRGEIGGPAMQREAFNADNVDRLLNRAAGEFVNSLRGTQKRGSRLQVATLFEEAAPFFFPDFDSDIRQHISRFAKEPVREILEKTDTVEATVREYRIADLAGGSRQPTFNMVNSISPTGLSTGRTGGSGFRVPPAMQRLLAQRAQKLDVMRRRGELTGEIFFDNIDLPGDPEDKGEVE